MLWIELCLILDSIPAVKQSHQNGITVKVDSPLHSSERQINRCDFFLFLFAWPGAWFGHIIHLGFLGKLEYPFIRPFTHFHFFFYVLYLSCCKWSTARGSTVTVCQGQCMSMNDEIWCVIETSTCDVVILMCFTFILIPFIIMSTLNPGSCDNFILWLCEFMVSIALNETW